MFETGLSDAPGFRARRESYVFHFRRVIESTAGAGDRDAAGVARAPNDGKAQIFVGVVAAIVFPHVSPFQKVVSLIWRARVPDAGKIFVRQRRVDERVLPGIVAQNPVADDGGKLPDLDVDVRCRTVTEEIFVQSDLGAVVAWIKAAIDARLCKEIYFRSDLEIEEQT